MLCLYEIAVGWRKRSFAIVSSRIPTEKEKNRGWPKPVEVDSRLGKSEVAAGTSLPPFP